MEDVELYWLQFYVLILETERCLYNIQMLVLTRNFLIIFLVIQLQFKKKKLRGPTSSASSDGINHCDLLKLSLLYIWLRAFPIIGLLPAEMVGETAKGYYNPREKEWLPLKRRPWCENNVIGGLYASVIATSNQALSTER